MLIAALNNDDMDELLTGGTLITHIGNLPVTITFLPDIPVFASVVTAEPKVPNLVYGSGHQGDLYPLVRAGLLNAGQWLSVGAMDLAAQVQANGTLLIDDLEFRAPSPAAAYVRGVTAANGWAEFKTPAGNSLHDLRMASGLYVNVNEGTGRDARYRPVEGWENLV